jgi:hypothetical protein
MARNTLSKGGPGGGAGSRVVRQVPVRTGQPARKVAPGAVSQFGSALGNKATDHPQTLRGGVETLYRGIIPGPLNVPLGNQIAEQTVCKPGGSRAVQHCGSQGMHGNPNPGKPTPAKDILSEYGPESPNSRYRR